MSILSYHNMPGVCIDIQDEAELYEAIVVLRKQVIENIGFDSPTVLFLQDVLFSLKNKYKITPYSEADYGR
jgi:hypothetical protein